DTHQKVKDLLQMVRRMREQTARLLERADLGALEQALVDADQKSIKPIGLFAPEEYPAATQVQTLVAGYPSISNTASNAWTLAQRLEGELKELRKQVDELRELRKQAAPPLVPIPLPDPDSVPSPPVSPKQKKTDGDR